MAGAIILVAVFIRPVTGLYSLAFSVPFGSGIETSVGPFFVSITEALVVLTALGWIAGLSLRPSTRVFFPPLIWPIVLIVCALILSLANARSMSLGLKEIIKWLEVAAVLLMASNLLRGRGDQLTLIIVLLLAASSQAILGLVQSTFGLGPAGFLLENGILRAYGSFGQPNPYAGYLVASAAFGLGLAIGGLGLGGWRQWFPGAAAISVSSAIVLAGAAASLSRGAALAFVAAASTFSLRDRRTIAAILLASVGALMLIFSGITIALPEAIAARVNVTLEYFRFFDARLVEVTPENWPLVQRMALWQSAWYMFLHSPVTGVGAGNFDMAYPYFTLPAWSSFLSGHAHNYYLNLLAETGIIGLVSYAVFVIWIFIYCLQAFFSGRQTYCLENRRIASARALPEALEACPELCRRVNAGCGNIRPSFRESQGTGYLGSFSSFVGAPTCRGTVGSRENSSVSLFQPVHEHQPALGWRGLTMPDYLEMKSLWTNPSAVAWGVMASITALSVHNMFDNLYVHGIPIFVALLLGLLSSVVVSRGR